MLQAGAESALRAAMVLDQSRPTWMTHASLDIAMSSNGDGSMTTRWDVDTDSIRNVLTQAHVATAALPGQVIPLPVSASPPSRTPPFEAVTVTGIEGHRQLEPFHGESLVRSSGPLRPVFTPLNDRVIVSLGDPDLDEVTELLITVPFSSLGVSKQVIGILPRLLASMSPVGRFDIDLSDLRHLEVEHLRLSLPAEVQADQAILHLDTKLGPWWDDLQALTNELNTLPRVLRGRIVLRELNRIDYPIRQLAQHVRATRAQLRRLNLAEIDASVAEDTLHTAAVRLRRLADDQLAELRQDATKRGDRAQVSVRRLRRVVRRAIEDGSTVSTMPLIAPLPRTADGVASVDCPGIWLLRSVTVVYTTALSRLRPRRLGASASLLAMGVVLLMVAWRFQIMAPLDRHEPWPLEVVRAEAMRDSRDALVALLVIFPALLYMQIERVGTDNQFFDQTVGFTLAAASLGFITPVLIAVSALGDIRPNLILQSCWTAGIIFMLAGAGSLLLSNETFLSRRRKASYRRLIKK